MSGCQPRSVCLRGYLWVKNMLYILYKISRCWKVLLEILADMESVWNTKDGDIKYVFVGVVESCVKKVDFPFFGSCLWCFFLFWRCVFYFNVIFSLEKVSNLSDIAFLSIAANNIVSLATLDNSKFFWRTLHPVVSAAGESADNFTLVTGDGRIRFQI